MTLSLLSADFGTAISSHATRTDSGNTLSVLFDDLTVSSDRQDIDPQPTALRLDGSLRCEGAGWVTVDLRGYALSTAPHGYAHVSAWINGRRMLALPSGEDEPISASLTAPVTRGLLHISMLLLAQRDLTVDSSSAGCGVDSLDIRVVEPRVRRRP